MIRSMKIATALLAVLVLPMLFIPAMAQTGEQIYLETTSDQSTFKLEIYWTPADIESENTFVIKFIDPDTGKEIEDVKYDILLYREGNERPELRRVDQISTVQKLRFSEPGSYMVKIQNIEGLGENAILPIQVTPEFPAGPLAVMGAAISAFVVARLKRWQQFI